MRQKGFIPVLLIIGILIIVVLGGIYYFNTSNISKSQDQTANSDLTEADWKTYTNTKYSYSLKYPDKWYVISPGSDGAESINIQNYSEADVTQQEKQRVELSPGRLNIAIGIYEENITSSISLLDWLKVNGHYESALIGIPDTTEYIIISGKSILKLNYQNAAYYIFSNGKNVFYSYYAPNNSLLKNIFDQILSTFKFTD